MCGRLVVDLDEDTVAEVFGIAGPVDVRRTWNAAPGTDQLVVGTDAQNARRGGRYMWGFVPTWARDPSSSRKPINARSETVATKPTFRAAFEKYRCLVPVTGYYEWAPDRDGKQPWVYTVDDRAPFALAGLLSRLRLPDGEILRTFCVLTTEANELAARVHDRMPVIVDPSGWDTWLSGQAADPADLVATMRPFPKERMEAHPVSKRVNRATEDGPELVEPIELPVEP